MNLKAYFQRLWQGRVRARENIAFFIPVWLWFVFVVYIELRRLDEHVLIVTFFPAFIVSSIPFFLGRVGLMRWWVFAAVVPATAAAVSIQLLRSV